MNKRIFQLLIFTIHAIDIKQNAIITNSIIYRKIKWQLNPIIILFTVQGKSRVVRYQVIFMLF